MTNARLTFEVHRDLFVKDPESSPLGRKIVTESIEMIDSDGFEAFTFQKLATRCRSTEASVYRYFKNKRQLLGYLVAWYWGWIHHGMEQRMRLAGTPVDRLRSILGYLAEAMENDPSTYVNEGKLHRIVMLEGSKLEVTTDEAQRAFITDRSGLEFVVSALAETICQVKPKHEHPRTTALAAIILIHRLTYFLRSAPDFVEMRDDDHHGTEIIRYVEALICQGSPVKKSPQTKSRKHQTRRAR